MRATGPLLTLTALLLVLAALPDLLQRLTSRPGVWPAPPSSGSLSTGRPSNNAARNAARLPAPDPATRPLALLEGGLIDRLALADRTWIPRAEPLPDGGTRYLYKRRPGDPELSISQIKAVIAHPPSHEEERRVIVELLTTLQQVGAGVALTEPIKPGAAAEWDPQARTLRVRPAVTEQGSLEFARVLNHEAVHVAQSCAAGSLGASPRPLGVVPAGVLEGEAGGPDGDQTDGGSPPGIPQLDDPVYADLSPRERRMEQEAYTLQNRLGLGLQLIRIHCLAGRAMGA